MLAAILAFNTGPYLRQVLEALKRHDLRVVVIDNGSEPPLDPSNVECIRLEKSCGIIHGRNLGFSLRMDGEGVLAVADDVVVPDGPWERILQANPHLTLALRPRDDIAFTEDRRNDDPSQFPDYIRGAPTSFQCVYFPGPVLDKIGYVDERYLWGDDGLMMRKNPYGVLRNYKIISNQDLDRGPKYRPLRDFYEELWRPGKLDGEEWERMPVRHSMQDVDELISQCCPTLWTMRRKENPKYYDASLAIKESFEAIWDNIEIDRMELLKKIKMVERSANEEESQDPIST